MMRLILPTTNTIILSRHGNKRMIKLLDELQPDVRELHRAAVNEIQQAGSDNVT